MKLLKIAILTCGFLSIQGCGLPWLTNPKEQPIIEDKLGESGFHTLATTPERRVVIFKKDLKLEGHQLICAEPPADVADNLASSFASALEGSDGTVTAKAEITKAFASTAKQLFLRSQGVQLYRDGMYSLCQSFMNGAIDTKQLQTMQTDLLKKSYHLIKIEIPFLPYLKVDKVPSPTLPTPEKATDKPVDKTQSANPTGSDSEAKSVE